jgi:hypothetical protein
MTADDILDIIRTEYAKGTKRSKVASILGVSEDTVYERARAAGIVHPHHTRKVSQKDYDFIRENAANMTVAEVAAHLKRHKTTVFDAAKRVGVRFKHSSDRPQVRAVRIMRVDRVKPEPVAVVVDPFEPFVSPTLTAIHGKPMYARRNASGVALPYLPRIEGIKVSLGG